MRNFYAIVALFVILTLGTACASQSSVSQLEDNLNISQREIQGLENEIQSLKIQLAEDIAALRSETGEIAAKEILGDWGRDTPQVVRTQNNYQVLRDSVRDPNSGSASSQLNRALIRTANMASLIFIQDLMDGQSSARKLEVLNQCIEYIVGINSSTRSCNMHPIEPKP